MTAKDVIKVLKANSFVEKSQTGSHLKMTDGAHTAVVPMHGKKDLKIGVIKSIEAQSGIKLR